MNFLRFSSLHTAQKLIGKIAKLSLRYSSAESLHDIVEEKIKAHREKVKKFRKESDKFKLGETTVGTMYGGMRGVKGLIWETSKVDANEGICFRGLSIDDVMKKLPKTESGEIPLPEGLFWLLMTGDVPSKEQVKQIMCEWNDRAKLPDYIVGMLKAMPKTLHPMSQLSCALTALNNDSKFLKAQNEGEMNKTNMWEYAFEDGMDLIAKISMLAAIIYKNTFRDGEEICPNDPTVCWAANFSRSLGYNDEEFMELMRLYLTIHADHEGGNVSAHAAHLVASALSDPYLSYAAGLNGLAGPLHGKANQEVLIWLKKMQKEVGDSPTEEKIAEYVNKTLKEGQVVPGYGHAVLRKTDPRFTVQSQFATKHFPDDALFKVCSMVHKVVPPILEKLGKVQNPWPNVDAISGTLLQHYGMTEMNFYTVLFGVSRSVGVMANIIWARALGFPIERPISETTDTLMKLVEEKGKKNDDCKK